MLKKLKKSDRKDRIPRYRYSTKRNEQKCELIIDNENEWLYNIDMACNDWHRAEEDNMKEDVSAYIIDAIENDYHILYRKDCEFDVIVYRSRQIMIYNENVQQLFNTIRGKIEKDIKRYAMTE